MIGRIIELSGGAEALAKTLIKRFGNRRTPLALTVAGFMVGIPVFFEVGVIILMPLAYGVARAARKPLLIFLPMCAALLAVHAFLPPHPGAVAAASQLGADLGRVLMLGIPIVAVLCAIGYFVAGRMTRKTYPMTDDIRAEVYGPHVTNEDLEAWARNDYSSVRETTETRTLGAEETASSLASKLPPAPAPGFGLIIALILLPIVLILLGTLATRAVLTVLGAPLVGAVDRHTAVRLAAGFASRLEPFSGVRRDRLGIARCGHGDPDCRCRWRVRQSAGRYRNWCGGVRSLA